jgi:hypothetical protein
MEARKRMGIACSPPRGSSPLQTLGVYAGVGQGKRGRRSLCRSARRWGPLAANADRQKGWLKPLALQA